MSQEYTVHVRLILVKVTKRSGDGLHGLMMVSNEIASKVDGIYILHPSLEVCNLCNIIGYHLE